MINVHSSFMEELSDYLSEQDDPDARRMLAQVNLYFNNQTKVNGYQEDTLAFITNELSN